jgi:pimeloyl-ACP methyl ester carboxylesterase
MTGSPQIRTRQLRWTWQGQDFSLGVDEAGTGPTVLLLPALSSISTRREMRPLVQGLANRFSVIAPDWPGFGDQARPPIAWTPDALSSFLDKFVREQAPALHATIAAGHAATYALYLAAGCPDILGRLALLAPTWRGPLPTIVGGDRKLFHQIRHIVGFLVLGPRLYRLNVNPIVVPMTVAGHVYSDPRTLSVERIREKQNGLSAIEVRKS